MDAIRSAQGSHGFAGATPVAIALSFVGATQVAIAAAVQCPSWERRKSRLRRFPRAAHPAGSDRDLRRSYAKPMDAKPMDAKPMGAKPMDAKPMGVLALGSLQRDGRAMSFVGATQVAIAALPPRRASRRLGSRLASLLPVPINAAPRRRERQNYKLDALNVSQALNWPCCNPTANHRRRGSALPWVKLSGTA